jgi:D-3-phosphoglycerate dehydrogenase
MQASTFTTVNKSRSEMAYSLVDVDSPIPSGLIETLVAIDGVLSVRAIPAVTQPS